MKIIPNRRTRYIRIIENYRIVYEGNGLWMAYDLDGDEAGKLWQKDMDKYVQNKHVEYITQREFLLNLGEYEDNCK